MFELIEVFQSHSSCRCCVYLRIKKIKFNYILVAKCPIINCVLLIKHRRHVMPLTKLITNQDTLNQLLHTEMSESINQTRTKCFRY